MMNDPRPAGEYQGVTYRISYGSKAPFHVERLRPDGAIICNRQGLNCIAGDGGAVAWDPAFAEALCAHLNVPENKP